MWVSVKLGENIALFPTACSGSLNEASWVSFAYTFSDFSGIPLLPTHSGYLGDLFLTTAYLTYFSSPVKKSVSQKKCCHIRLKKFQYILYYTAFTAVLANFSVQGIFYKCRSQFYNDMWWGKSLRHMWCSNWACGPRRLQIASRFVAVYPFFIMIQWISHQRYFSNSQHWQNVLLCREFWKNSFYGMKESF